MANIEGLGVFYLGETYDLDKRQRLGTPILYESKHLTTHAVCVGMTGSGKTGLCVSLLEEAALDGIPALIIDPKGDLGNLLLQFPNLLADDFAPWVNPDEAQQAQMSMPDFARSQAESWSKGLADWHQDGARIARMRDAAEFVIYTPGSSMGRKLSILKSFQAPSEAVLEDREMFADRVQNSATALLSLLGIDADPLQSREHILLSQIFQANWAKQQSLDLAAIIGQIQDPPIKKIGVLDVDSFYPAKERFALAMQINNLLASPGFNVWMEGEGLDIASLLRNAQGKPKVSVISIAHLSDQERMFFVALLLNEVLAWVRTQAGTSSLRAILYMDEIFGYFPPTANPPSKRPLLTLLKQARAFGVGIVLATQNPVDLDYKGLANCGTWFIGRLQTERDKERLMEGLAGASAQAGQSFDRSRTQTILSSLGKRVFYMNNVHQNTPTIFQTRWALSYLRGPLTREQIKALSAAAPQAPAAVAAAVANIPNLPQAAARPILPPDIVQKFLPPRGATKDLMYYPHLCVAATIRFVDPKAAVDCSVEKVYLTPIRDDNTPVEWTESQAAEIHPDELETSPIEGIGYAEICGAATKPKSYVAWQKDLATYIYGMEQLQVLSIPDLKVFSAPGETESSFRARLSHELHEKRDAAVEKVQAKYASKVVTLQERIRRAEQAKQREAEQRSGEMFSTGLDILGGVFGAVFGGGKTLSKTNIGKAASAARKAGKVLKENQDVARADETVEALQSQMEELKEQIELEASELATAMDAANAPISILLIKPKKTNIALGFSALVWAPCHPPSKGSDSPQAAW